LMSAEAFRNEAAGEPPVRGFLHRTANSNSDALVLTHGAGASCASALLVSLAEAFCAAGITVLRCDLPFRQRRPHGPPLGTAREDQTGLRRAADLLRSMVPGRVFLGGHSYGGRMASMLAAEDGAVTDGLLLLSYPLHPPKKPMQLRTAHFPNLHTPAVFVHGSRDSFASAAEMNSALELIPTKTKLLEIEGAGHELIKKRSDMATIDTVVKSTVQFLGMAKMEKPRLASRLGNER
jgi:predicted alpha/beta-hydrolase family hydrolase